MTIIKRQDGIQFIAETYRETLSSRNKRALTEEVRRLAAEHGQFLSLRRCRNQQLEIACGKEPGFLLGELVWDFFGRPDNLIFCEAIADSANCLLVIVQEGRVYLDQRLLTSELREVLLPIFADDHRYDIYTYGDLPLRDSDTFGDATFKPPKKIVAKFNHLKQPVFTQLLVSPEFELQPLPTVLRSRQLRDHRLVFALSAAVIILGGGWWLLSGSTTDQPLSPTASINAFQNYQLALSSPNPTAVIDELAQKIDQIYLIPGWKAVSIVFDHGKYQVDMHSEGGNLWYLTDWAKQHYYDLRMTPRGALLTLDSHLKKRKAPQHYPLSQKVVSQFEKRLSEILTSDAVHVEESLPQGNMQETKFTLELKELSPDLLDLVGRELEDLPLSLSSIHIHLEDGLIDGQIQLSLWGTNG